MGVITGLPGVGKTIALQDYLDNQAPHVHTALPIAIKVTVLPRSTPRAFAKTIMDGLLEKPRGNNIYEIADEAAAAIERNDLKLIGVGEANRLNEDSFEVLRHLYDKTGCRILLVGLLSILQPGRPAHAVSPSRAGGNTQRRPSAAGHPSLGL